VERGLVKSSRDCWQGEEHEDVGVVLQEMNGRVWAVEGRY